MEKKKARYSLLMEKEEREKEEKMKEVFKRDYEEGE